jgi:hypothetical protein
MADFAMFTLDMGEYKENGKVCFPHLTGKDSNLWDVVPQLVVLPPAKVDSEEAKRQENLAKYIEQGFGFESPDGQIELVDEPQDEGDEWDKFFAVDCHLVGGKCRRKGGIKKTAAFEGFVDSAQ